MLWNSIPGTQEKYIQYSTKLKNLKYENLSDVLRETKSWGRVRDLDLSLQLCEILVKYENKNLGSSFLLKNLIHHQIYSKHLLWADEKLCCGLPSNVVTTLATHKYWN